MKPNQYQKDQAHSKPFKDALLGKRIINVRYMHPDEAEAAGFYKRPIMILLDDGTWIVPQSDDEGNDGGALILFPDADIPETIIYTI